MTKPALSHDEAIMTVEEQAFLRAAREKYLHNADWFEFEDFVFGSRSPLFTKERSHQDILEHPLYIALKEMWLELGVRQGRVAANEEVPDAPRRKTRGSR